MSEFNSTKLIEMSETMLCADGAPTWLEVGYLLRRVIPALKQLDAQTAEIEQLRAYMDESKFIYARPSAPDRLEIPKRFWERLNADNARLTAENTALRERCIGLEAQHEMWMGFFAKTFGVDRIGDVFVSKDFMRGPQPPAEHWKPNTEGAMPSAEPAEDLPGETTAECATEGIDG